MSFMFSKHRMFIEASCFSYVVLHVRPAGVICFCLLLVGYPSRAVGNFELRILYLK
jgi:hypothetical protein